MRKLLSITLLAVLIAASLFVVQPAQASVAICGIGGINALNLYGSLDYQTEREIKGNANLAAAVKQLIEPLHYIKGPARSTNPYKVVGGYERFQANGGAILADNNPKHYVKAQWQYVYTFMFGVNLTHARTLPNGNLVIFDELVTVLVATHTAAPGRAFWFYIPAMESGNNHASCGSAETSLDYARSVYNTLDGYPF